MALTASQYHTTPLGIGKSVVETECHINRCFSVLTTLHMPILLFCIRSLLVTKQLTYNPGSPGWQFNRFFDRLNHGLTHP